MAVITHKRAESRFGKRVPTWKRLMDLLGGGLILTLLSPLLLAVALYIKIVSPGPAFFKQERVGRTGRVFTMWKFRTMKANTDTSRHQTYMADLIKRGSAPGEEGETLTMEKLDAENPDIIPLGNFLRGSCLDELPQLFNVVRGEMSLVGPRPVIPYEAEEYLRWHAGRFDVIPGMTGLWQVSGKNRLTFNEMIRLDIRYGREMSPALDVLILLKTPSAILQQISEKTSAEKSERAEGALSDV